MQKWLSALSARHIRLGQVWLAVFLLALCVCACSSSAEVLGGEPARTPSPVSVAAAPTPTLPPTRLATLSPADNLTATLMTDIRIPTASSEDCGCTH